MVTEVAVIGAAGKMGSWFVNYFAMRTQRVCAYDVNSRALKSMAGNVLIAKSISDCVKNADLVLVCIPVQLTPDVIRKCAKGMKSGAVIAEIASVKHKAMKALRQVKANRRPLSIHPMFGPGASDKKQLKILLIPVRNENAEMKIAHELFDNVDIKVLPDADTHDRSIGLVLGLTYFTNLAFGSIISKEERLARFKEIAGTTFTLQSVLAESILTEEPELILALIRENPHAGRYIKRYLTEGSELAKLAFGKDSTGLERKIKQVKSRLQKSQDLQLSYRRMYEALERLQ